jgi:hypothetical protein
MSEAGLSQERRVRTRRIEEARPRNLLINRLLQDAFLVDHPRERLDGRRRASGAGPRTFLDVPLDRRLRAGAKRREREQ